MLRTDLFESSHPGTLHPSGERRLRLTALSRASEDRALNVDIEITLADGDAVMGWFVVGDHRVEFAANVTWIGNQVWLSQLHLEGEQKNTLGISGLRAAIRAFMRQNGITLLVINGGERRTGASVGKLGSGPRMPHRLYFRLEDGS